MADEIVVEQSCIIGAEVCKIVPEEILGEGSCKRVREICRENTEEEEEEEEEEARRMHGTKMEAMAWALKAKEVERMSLEEACRKEKEKGDALQAEVDAVEEKLKRAKEAKERMEAEMKEIREEADRFSADMAREKQDLEAALQRRKDLLKSAHECLIRLIQIGRSVSMEESSNIPAVYSDLLDSE